MICSNAVSVPKTAVSAPHKSIQSYATLATIIFQTNQNEQHGGQAIPAFDFFMAKGVAKSFRKHLSSFINFYVAMENGIQADEKAIRTHD